MLKKTHALNMQDHIYRALECLGEIYHEYEPDNDHNKDTAKRITKSWIEMCKGLADPDFTFTTFLNEDSPSGSNWVIKKDIEFSSLCAHHFMPFMGKITIGYVPNDRICGISKLDRVVNYFSKRPQVQERLGNDIRDFLADRLRTNQIVVIIESMHTCVACRGIESRNSTMITTHTFATKDLLMVKELIK